MISNLCFKCLEKRNLELCDGNDVSPKFQKKALPNMGPLQNSFLVRVLLNLDGF